MTIELLAPAKINLGLEVIRRRNDGYHDIATVLQTISVFDRIRIEASAADEVQITNRLVQFEANLATRALAESKASGLTQECYRIEIEKRIPIAAGLGGASADAAAVLRALSPENEYDQPDLAKRALQLGSDVPFLLRGGAALATSRGEVLEPLPPLRNCWLVLASPEIELERKTARLYAALREDDFSDGSASRSVASALRQGAIPPPVDLQNAFSRALATLMPEIGELSVRFHQAGASFVAISGAGPTHYTIAPTLSAAISISTQLASRPPRPMRVLIARPVGPGLQRRRHKTHETDPAL
jgi:4-diphosphocytidyl-2-C-methyl-D-erythritol kinase